MDEEKAYREDFPLAFRRGQNFKHLNFRMDKAMKYSLLDELQRQDIDLFMFHEHGLPTNKLLIMIEPEIVYRTSTFDED